MYNKQAGGNYICAFANQRVLGRCFSIDKPDNMVYNDKNNHKGD